MSLVPDYDDSSNSSDLSNNDSDAKGGLNSSKDDSSIQTTIKSKLPTPNFNESNSSADDVKSSVFKNPFLEAENAKEAILQKHVKMVETKDNVIVINGKKICWNYRKGRCRFGHNCKFAHDSDIQKTEGQIELEKAAAKQSSIVCQNSQIGQHISQNNIVKDLEELQVPNHKRKRPGLTQGLVPGKKVMKQYLKNQKI